MIRIYATLSILFILAACGIGVWMATRPPTISFLAPGATKSTVRALGWNQWQISYDAAADVNVQFETYGWYSPDQWLYGPLSRTYMHVTSFGVGELREWAFVWIDPIKPQTAHIRVRRWIDLPWLWNLLE